MDNTNSSINTNITAETTQDIQKPKVVLGFSGGLDTSYCVKYLTIEKKI